MSYELRAQGSQFIKMLLPQGRKNFKRSTVRPSYAPCCCTRQITVTLVLATMVDTFCRFFTFSSILIFAFTRPVSSTRIEADYLKEVDPQIYALLNGEMLSSPLKLMKY